MRTATSYISWCLQIVGAMIMLQTLYFKFTAAEESVYIFSTLGMEPVGRVVAGVSELIASILLLIPSKAWLGALLGIGTMVGAILSHIAILGIEVMNDGGQLFIYAMIVLFSCLGVLWIHREQPITLLKALTHKTN